MREQGDGEASNAAILERVRAERANELHFLTPELVNMALIKLLNEVSNRRAQRGNSPEGINLFGDYCVPRIVTIIRGKKKDTAKLSFREAELYVKAHSEKSVSDRHEPLRRLLEACREYVESDEDTLETLMGRKKQADELAIQ
ncbi:MAG: hypothetical protein ABIO86_16255 [Sphingomonas sp.]